MDYKKRYSLKRKKVILLSMLTKAMEIGIAFLLSDIMDQVASGTLQSFTGIIAGTCIYILSLLLVSIITKMCRMRYVSAVMNDIRNRLVSGFLAKKSYEKNTGMYLSVMQKDLEQIEKNLIQTDIDIVINIFVFCAAVLSLIYINPLMAVVSFIFSVPILIVPKLFGTKLQKLNNEFIEANAGYIGQIKDYLDGLEVIQSFGVVRLFYEKLLLRNKERVLSERKYEACHITASSIAINLGVWLQFAVYILAGMLAVAGKISIGAMISSIQLCGYMVQPVQSIVQCQNQRKASSFLMEKLNTYMTFEEQTEEDKLKRNRELEAGITFENVCFSYKNENKTKFEMKDLNVTLEAHKKYLLIGESGSGKSTLIKLMNRTYEPDSGKIMIGTIPLNTISPERISDYVTVIGQNVYLFHDTIKNNITLYGAFKEQEVIEALKAVEAFDFVCSMEHGLDTVIEENGRNLSGGQAQRLATARAFLWDAPIFIFDEATSKLDNELAQKFEKMILARNNKTVLNIAHRVDPENIHLYDNVYEMKNGTLTSVRLNDMI